MRHHEFCATDPLFYDQPGRRSGPGFAAALRVPDGWTTQEGDTWRMLHPEGLQLPAQGWKIHVSATAGNAERVLAAVHRHCTDRGIAYKHLRSPQLLHHTNAKYADRASSGKFVTVYPVDGEQLRTTVDGLAADLVGEPGPYVLSDLRIGAGPVYTRYGGFARRFVDADGTRVPAVEAPDGSLVPDRREPRFQLPAWVALPEFLRSHEAARAATEPDAFPYTVTEALHYSNGGGVYRATRHSDGRTVVLKEARPHAGLDGAGRDAVHRIEHEHAVLQRLADVPGVVGVHDLHTAWEHRFLVLEPAPGVSLKQWLTQHYPQGQADDDARDTAAYVTRALSVADQVATAVARVHARGVVIGDLHPGNVMVASTGDGPDRVTLIDFEAAGGVDDEPASTRLGAPGFRAPVDRRGAAADRYALAVLRVWLFLPLAPVLELAPEQVHRWLDHIVARFELPATYSAAVLAELGATAGPARTPAPWPADTGPDGTDRWPQLRARIVDGILAAATPGRHDRLFPGDPYQFQAGPAGLAHGAAGVLHALHTVGAGPAPEHVEWLLDAVRHDPPDWPGLYHGSHGVAAVLDGLGRHAEAGRLVDQHAADVERTVDPGLANGLAGIGIGLLGLAAAGHRAAAVTVAERLAELLDGPANTSRTPESGAGLRHGWSGAALLFTRVFTETGADRWLDLADRALRRDIDTCVPSAGGGLQVLDGRGRVLSYLDSGVAGITLAVAELARSAPDAPAVAALPALVRGCTGELVVQPGLAQGRAGLVLALAAARAAGATGPAIEPAIGRHLAHMSWHAVEHGGTVMFPGHQLLRLSTDLVTGSAGILLALQAALGPAQAPLPYPWGPRPAAAAAPRTSATRPEMVDHGR